MKASGLIHAHILCAFFFVCFLSYGCQHPGPGENNAIIKGNIPYLVNSKVYVYGYANDLDKYLGIKTALDSVSTDNDGNYLLRLNWNHPDQFDLKSGKDILSGNLFLIPNDEITIDFDALQKKPLIDENGETANYNRFIISYIDTFYEKPLTKHLYYIQTNYLTPEQFIFYCEDRKKKQLKFYDDYFNEVKVKTSFSDLMVSEIIYQSAVDRLMYAWKKRMKGQSKIIDSTFYDFIIPSLVENQKAMTSPAYFRFLNLYIKDIFERMLERGEIPINKSEKFNPSIEKYKIAIQKLNFPFLNIVLCNIIHDDMIASGDSQHPDNFSKIPLDSLINGFRVKYNLPELHTSN